MLQSLYAGNNLLKTRGIQLKSNIHRLASRSAPIISRNLPVTFYPTRQFSSTLSPNNQTNEPVAVTRNTVGTIKKNKPLFSVHDDIPQKLASYEALGDVEGAFNYVKELHAKNLATKEIYERLVTLLSENPTEIAKINYVLNWFTQSSRSKNKKILEDIDLWCKVMGLGFKLKGTSREQALRMYLQAFEATFPYSKLTTQTAWVTKIRAHGILCQPLKVTECLKEIKDSPKALEAVDEKQIFEYAILAYANCQMTELVDKHMQLFKDTPSSKDMLKSLTLTNAFRGNIEATKKYSDLTERIYPSVDLTSVRLLSYQRDLVAQYKNEARIRGTHNAPLNLDQDKAAAWNELAESLMNDDKRPLNINECNNIVGYLATANSLDNKQFPMERAQGFVDNYMTKHSIQPNETTYSYLLTGYARTHEYNDGAKNSRLDKALETLHLMLSKNLSVVNHRNFSALLKACIPHKNENYIFDYFRYNSAVKTSFQNQKLKKIFLDKRFFEIEKLMLEYDVNYDRYTFMNMMTCLGGSGLYIALWNRWGLTKKYGIKRDAALYQHMLALAARDSEQARFALATVKSELARDIGQDKMTKPLYFSLLECSVSAQNTTMTGQIIETLRKDFELTTEDYNTLIRSSAFLGDASSKVDDILEEMKKKNIQNNTRTWLNLLSNQILAKAEHNQIQKTFNDYSMYRFEEYGKVPIPIRKQAKTVPFPTGPYTGVDQQIINVYLASLVDHQDLSLLFGILRTSEEQELPIRLTVNTINWIKNLAQKEKSKDDLAWFINESKLGKIIKE
ncbi:hypothetical protein J3Q64DRAFT_1766785 [Phycomyces blakesleeanus]|uniref:Mitochondrial group I intron splicing factor CCM1 n=1 Tax=Phycomyces blakesleeanus TaxID=4837 RepID=A0ABR3AQU3_PHYBL